MLDALYGCGSSVNWDSYCNAEVDKLIEQQSMASDPARRKQILWTIERKLAEDVARPIIFYDRAATLLAALRQRPDDDGRQHLRQQSP